MQTQDDTIQDVEYEEIDQPNTDKAQTKQFSKKEALEALTAAGLAKSLSKSQIAQMRVELGITQAYFTRKQIPKSKRIAKRKAQKLARRNNRVK